MEEVKVIKSVKCNETVWLRVKITSGIDLYIGCVYVPTQGSIKHLCTDRFNLLEEDIYTFQSKGRVLLFWWVGLGCELC